MVFVLSSIPLPGMSLRLASPQPLTLNLPLGMSNALLHVVWVCPCCLAAIRFHAIWTHERYVTHGNGFEAPISWHLLTYHERRHSTTSRYLRLHVDAVYLFEALVMSASGEPLLPAFATCNYCLHLEKLHV